MGKGATPQDGPGQDAQGALPGETAALSRAILETAEDIAAVLRGATDTSLPVPDSEWTVGEAAAHLAQANELMADLAAGRERPYGDGTAQSLAGANEEALAAFGERRAEPLAEMIVNQAESFVTALAKPAPADSLATPLGAMSLDVLGSYLLAHMLGHGYDLARALRRPHMIDATRVELSLPMLLTAMPRVVNTEAAARMTARYAIRLRGGTAFGVTLTNGAVTVTPSPPERPHCTIVTAPVSFLLMALGRRGPWQAMTRGHVLAWGPRPWLAPRFPALFTAP